MPTTITNKHTWLIFVALSPVLTALLLTGCSPKKLPAYGAANELTIVTNLSTQDQTVKLLESAFAKPLTSVDEDTSYLPDVIPASEFARDSRRLDASRNLVLLVDISKHDSLTKKIQDLLGTKIMTEIMEGSGEYFVRSNVWALAQTLTIIVGASSESLANVIKTRGDRIYAEMDSLVTERTKDALYAGGEQTSVTSGLASKYGWSLRVPLGFNPMELDTVETGMLLKFKADEPTRLVFVYWMPYNEGEPLDAKKCMELRTKLVWACYDEDVIDYAKTITRDVVFEGRKAVRAEGVWQNQKYVIGGPFFTYCFPSGDRFYMIDAVVFAPGTHKGAFLKQLEAMIMTFKG
jgi:hypothetical protein